MSFTLQLFLCNAVSQIRELNIYILTCLLVAQGTSANKSPTQPESPESQQALTTSSHSFIMKKKQRTPEEGSRAICRKALIAALGNTTANCSLTKTPSSLTESSCLPCVQTEAPSPVSPYRKIVDRSYFSSNLHNSEDVVAFKEDNISPNRVILQTQLQDNVSEAKSNGRVSLPFKKFFFKVMIL